MSYEISIITLESILLRVRRGHMWPAPSFTSNRDFPLDEDRASEILTGIVRDAAVPMTLVADNDGVEVIDGAVRLMLLAGAFLHPAERPDSMIVPEWFRWLQICNLNTREAPTVLSYRGGGRAWLPLDFIGREAAFSDWERGVRQTPNLTSGTVEQTIHRGRAIRRAVLDYQVVLLRAPRNADLLAIREEMNRPMSRKG